MKLWNWKRFLLIYKKQLKNAPSVLKRTHTTTIAKPFFYFRTWDFLRPFIYRRESFQ